MLVHAKDLFDLEIRATDGEIGSVADLYFDDRTWEVRYLVVDTGGWFSGERVLLTPEAWGVPNWEKKELPVSLTRKAVENSPTALTARPISRQYEVELHQHYGWTPYWVSLSSGAMPTRVTPTKNYPLTGTETAVQDKPAASAPPQTEAEAITQTRAAQEQAEPHLRSMREVIGYHIQARDGEIGHVETFMLDDSTWRIQYLVIDTRNWLPGRKVPVALTWVTDVNWPDGKVSLDLSKETIKNSPEIDLDQPITEEKEKNLTSYFSSN